MTFFKQRSNRSHNFKLVIRFLIILLAPFFLISSQLKPWQGDRNFPFFLQSIVYPFEYMIYNVHSSVSSLIKHYIFLSNTARENTFLKKEIHDLKTKVSIDHQKTVSEISRLRKLLGFKNSMSQAQIIAAEVVGHYNFLNFQSFRLSKGEKEGVKVDMPIVAADGLIGKVIRTSYFFADVQLITDTNFVLDVFIERTRVRAILHGTNESYCQMQLNRRADIKIGDTIITSGMLDLFPKGLPVGKVIRISHDTDEVSQIIKIQPWVDSRSVEEVVIIQNSNQHFYKEVTSSS